MFVFSNAETVVTDVALAMGFILFCVADCCAERRLFGVFFKVTAVILSIIDL